MLLKIFNILKKEFSSQGWWPTTRDDKLIPEYNSSNSTRALSDKERLEIVFGAILTQNTSWKNVEKAIINLNKNNLINVNKISNISQEELAELIKSSGYFNQKAERLKIFCNYLIKNYEGNISKFFEKNIDELRQELLSIKGIGPETADSIILYAAQKPIFVIDAYTKRVFSRLGICNNNINYDQLQQLFHSNLKNDVKLFNEYHALIVELAKGFCKTKPLCNNCPINNICKKII